MSRRVGILASSALPSSVGIEVLCAAERAGFAEAWVGEDVGHHGAFAIAGTALARTAALPVGIGIASLGVRHPVLLAQEAGTLAQLHPGRFRLGIGVGSRPELEPIGRWPARQLDALEGYAGAVRALLAGETAADPAADYRIGGTRLAHPPQEPPPIYLGALGPKMLELSGRVADGTVGSIATSPAYVRWARALIDAGAGDAPRRPFVVFALFTMGDDGAAARASMRQMLGAALARGLAGGMRGFVERCCGEDLTELTEAVKRDGAGALAEPLAAGLFDPMAIAGDPAECAAQVRALWEAGADCVCLAPLPPADAPALVERAGAQLLPLLGEHGEFLADVGRMLRTLRI